MKTSEENGGRPSGDRFLVVGVGASAGGLEALEAFFAEMPEDSGLCFVVVQHLSPDFKSLMKELLSRRTSIAVEVAEDGSQLKPDSILLIPPRSEPTVEGNALLLHQSEPGSPSPHLPIDSFFVSLAAAFGERAVGVVLSGTGSDGSRGVVAITEAGGVSLCQAPDSAAFDGMPKSAFATGAVHAELEPAQMAQWLASYAQDRSVEAGHVPRPLEDYPVSYAAHLLSPIFQILSDNFQVDFNLYKSATIARRIDRRVRLKPGRTLESYAKVLQDDKTEVRALYEDLLIGVTQFMRDADSWARLEHSIVPQIFDRAGEHNEIRCWVAGTASGEEAYTLAMLLIEYARANQRFNPLRIFATDIHTDSIEFASQGVYPGEQVEQLDAMLVSRYFNVRPDGQYQVSAELRKVVVFAQHDLLRDPPFTKLSLVTCRNVLIYFQQTAQRRALSLFHFGLEMGGFLFLGASETVSELTEEFETVDRRWKQYKKVRNNRLPLSLHETRSRVAQPAQANTLDYSSYRAGAAGGARSLHLMRAYDALLEEYVPPSLLVNPDGRLVHTFGDGRDYILLPSGPTTVEIGSLVLPELRVAVETAVRRIKGGERSILLAGLPDRSRDGEEHSLTLAARALGNNEEPEFLLISFESTRHSDPLRQSGATTEIAKNYDLSEQSAKMVRALEDELRYSREQLQTVTEELETTNEELQATNEELMASNEELQSSNEELQSVNEELYSVNREYEEKIDELTQLNSDIDNLLVSTSIGTIFLDAKLQIRRFTPEAARHFDLLPNDVGRPLKHLNGRIDCPNLFSLLSTVAEGGGYRQLEVQHVEGGWFLMRLHPYLNTDNQVHGVVMTFIDITEQKVNERRVARSSEDLQEFAYSVSHDLQAPLRSILGFSNLIERRLGKDLGVEQSREYFAMINESGSQLKGMLNGLLQFSRIITQGKTFEAFDLDVALDLALDRLSHLMGPATPSIRRGYLPQAWGDSTQISSVFEILLQNAIENCEGPEKLEVRIRAKAESDDYWRIEVRDNGDGVSPQNQESIFRLFNRGRRQLDIDKVEQAVEAKSDLLSRGLGIGLAVARRIVDRHGGRIHCRQRPGPGTVFWFTLPKRPPSHDDRDKPKRRERTQPEP